MKFFLSTFFIFTLFAIPTFSKTAEEWKSRSVYQIITDRFAKTDGDATPCDNLGNYCGGTYKGIQNNLDYIQGMGFDAIWISPIVSNTPGGYHGYWTKDLYELNENFGTPEEFHALVKECHDRDIWVMVDVVANHIGYADNGNYSSMVPFNDISYFNEYRHCDEVFSQGADQAGVESCWLSGLPDLNQNHPFVRDAFISWVSDFVQIYNIDALRIDTVPHVPKDFWAEFSQASGVYTIGEVLNFDMPYLAGYQGPIDGILNYALYSTLRYTFQNGGNMESIQHYYDAAYATWPDITVLGNFVNNHDNPRFLHGNTNHQGFKAALAFTLASVGIPMVYYGDEQAYGGGIDPANREPLWTNMNKDTEIYNYLKTINKFRKDTEFYKYDQVQRYADNNFYAFSRGDSLFAFTNSQEYQERTITYHPYAEGTTLCNVFHAKDCVEVRDGAFKVVLINGEAKIFSPQANSEEQPLGISAWKKAKNALGNRFSLGIERMSSFTRISN